jgi:hypothetical protein
MTNGACNGSNDAAPMPARTRLPTQPRSALPALTSSTRACSFQAGIPAEPDRNRRVLAVLAFLRAGR